MIDLKQKIIVVAGSNGRLGKLVCDALLRRAEAAGEPVLVRALVRMGKAPPSSEGRADVDPKLVVVPVDYSSDADLARACEGAYSVVSTLQGGEPVLVDVQSRLLRASIAAGVRRFIPSDYSIDFTVQPRGTNRNFDTRLTFHDAARRIIAETKSPIELTAIFQAAFTELFSSGRVLLDFKKRRVTYFGSADTPMDFTTWADTAEYTAAVALDPKATPFKLHISGVRLSPRDVQQLATKVTGVSFGLKRVTSIGGLRALIAIIRFLKPGKNEPMPIWVGMQYALSMALGTGVPERLDNDRYPDIRWTGADDVIRRSFEQLGAGDAGPSPNAQARN